MSIDIPLTSKAISGQRSTKSTTLWLKIFIVSFSVALAGGLYYYLVPHSFNWTVSQTALIAHMIGGIVAMVSIIPFTIAHQKGIEGSSSHLLAPWLSFKRSNRESVKRYRKRLIGHALYWAILILNLSGVALVLPGILWLAGIVWMQGYSVSYALTRIHLGVTFVVVGLLALHITGRQRDRRNV